MDKIIKKDGHYIDCSQLAKHYHVYTEYGVVYTCTLNQTNIKTNNNKFYILQLLECDNEKEYLVYTRYGRIGDHGTKNQKQYSDSLSAISEYKKIFRQKTGNFWELKHIFKKINGKYFMSDISYDEEEKEEKEEKE